LADSFSGNPLLPRSQPRAIKPAVLAIDGGNSKTDVALVASDGTLLASARGPGINAHDVGVDQTVLILDAVVKQAAAQVHASRSGWVALHTVACLANADLPEEEAEHAAAVQAQGWSPTATVVNDTFAILRSGLADRAEPRWGVAVVCGAGINAVGVAPDGRVTRYLALGTISGDWGGGYGLGLEVLWHAIRAEDGRGPATALTGYLTSHFGVERVEEITIGIHKGKINDDELIGLAPLLLQAADEGDRVARAVVNRLADEISVMAITAMRRLDLAGQATPVILGGGVITARNPLLMDGINRQLAKAAPRAQVRVIDVPPVVGAALLGLDHVHAPPASESRLRAAYDGSPSCPGSPIASRLPSPRRRPGAVLGVGDLSGSAGPYSHIDDLRRGGRIDVWRYRTRCGRAERRRLRRGPADDRYHRGPQRPRPRLLAGRQGQLRRRPGGGRRGHGGLPRDRHVGARQPGVPGPGGAVPGRRGGDTAVPGHRHRHPGRKQHA
jgi:N-acetylglucosamine kinase-like BadF-type ATPase